MKRLKKNFHRKKIMNGPLNRAKWARIIAKFIDLMLVCLAVIFFYPMGLILGIVYLAVSDSLFDGQSIGKRFMGFAVVSLIDGSSCSLKQSFLRNLPFITPFIFLIFPYLGWVMSSVFALSLIFVEVNFLFKGETSHRLGDIIADTTVIANDGTRLDLRKNKSSWLNNSAFTQR